MASVTKRLASEVEGIALAFLNCTAAKLLPERLWNIGFPAACNAAIRKCKRSHVERSEPRLVTRTALEAGKLETALNSQQPKTNRATQRIMI